MNVTARSKDRSIAIEHGSLGKEHLRLQDVHLSFLTGQLTLLVGDTGAGKSTLLEAMAGLWPLDEGQIFIGQQPLYKKRGVHRRALELVSLCVQQPEQQLFAQTIRAELLYSLQGQKMTQEERTARCTDALTAVSLSPDLLLTPPLHLSGGQKRKVALASVLITNSDWLLLDEPTAALDASAAQQVVASIVRLAHTKQVGIVLATHDIDLWLPYADRVVVLEAGMVAGDYRAADRTIPADGYLSPSQFASCAPLLQALRAHGIEVTPTDTAPDTMAASLTSYVLQEPSASAHALTQAVGATPARSKRDEPTSALLPERMQKRADPRALWLSYLLLSTAILLQNGWLGVTVGLLCVAWWLKRLHVSLLGALKGVRGFAAFLLVAALLSGLQVHLTHLHGWTLHNLQGSVTLQSEASLQSAFTLSRILLLLVGGTTLSSAVPFLQMKAALEKLLRFLRTIGFPVEAAALGGALTVRFIPLIAKEAQRMRRIVFLRNKRKNKKQTVRLLDLRAFAIPLVLSILQTAEDFALALEIRGYRTDGPHDEDTAHTHWQQADWLLLGQTALASVVLLALRNAK